MSLPPPLIQSSWMGLICRPKYFFIWSRILGDIVVCSASPPSKSFDSMDATDQPPPLMPTPLTLIGPYLDRSPSRGGRVFAERSEDGILDGGSGGSPVLLDLSVEAEADVTLCDEWYAGKYAPVTERDPIDESSPSANIAVECDSDCVGSVDKDSFLGRGSLGLLQYEPFERLAPPPKKGSFSDRVSMAGFPKTSSTTPTFSVPGDVDRCED